MLVLSKSSSRSSYSNIATLSGMADIDTIVADVLDTDVRGELVVVVVVVGDTTRLRLPVPPTIMLLPPPPLLTGNTVLPFLVSVAVVVGGVGKLSFCIKGLLLFTDEDIVRSSPFSSSPFVGGSDDDDFITVSGCERPFILLFLALSL
eukprot:TRINITY_DN67741_c11_g1_i2.p2 TRINITY_DN67741_c11_g1~~TRINITY_DN67741_c11_g1_i2.p2  ORF type:complete len:148 (-),score=12.02 TRINITY_DN67741_c11_g1_i2:576-1019(-)